LDKSRDGNKGLAGNNIPEQPITEQPIPEHTPDNIPDRTIDHTILDHTTRTTAHLGLDAGNGLRPSASELNLILKTKGKQDILSRRPPRRERPGRGRCSPSQDQGSRRPLLHHRHQRRGPLRRE
jgi:hypothetical protein